MLDGQVSGPLGVPLPVVLGEPDASVMARYLARSLQAVGAFGEIVAEKPDACDADLPSSETAQLPQPDVRASQDRVRVNLRLPAGEACGALVARFGLLGGPIAEETRCLSAIVTTQTTDYDCDALVGECLRLLRA